MASIRMQALAAMVTALNGAGKPAAVTVHRQRALPIERDTLPAVVLYVIEEQAQGVPEAGFSLTARQCTVRAECRVSCATTEVPDDVLDPVVTWVVQALASDPQLGGLANFLTEQHTSWDAVAADKVYAAAAVDFLMAYDTATSNPESRN